MPSYQDYLNGTKQILNESQKEKDSYVVQVCGRDFIVFPEVFSPKYFHDTEIFARHLPITPGESFLEIGPGTGAVSITAAYKEAARVLAIDVNHRAVANTYENILKHGMSDRIEVRFGDIYGPIKDGERFDTIFWNVPFGFVPYQVASELEKAIYSQGYGSIEHFIKSAHRYLKLHGRLLIGFSSTLGRLDLIEKYCDEAGYKLKLLYEEESEEVHPVKFEIFEAH